MPSAVWRHLAVGTCSALPNDADDA